MPTFNSLKAFSSFQTNMKKGLPPQALKCNHQPLHQCASLYYPMRVESFRILWRVIRVKFDFPLAQA